MIDMYVQHEPCYAQLAEHVEVLVREAVPWVEKVTGLPLPRPRFELVDIDGCATAYRSFIRRQLEHDTAGVDLSGWDQTRIAAQQQAAEVVVRRAGLARKPVLVATSIGQPSTLIVPEALGLQKLCETPGLLCDLLVRSLAQQAQVIAGSGRVVPPPQWPKIPGASHPVVQLSRGHAQWTSSRVVREITGIDRPARRRPARRIVRSVLAPVTGRRTARASALVDQAVRARGLASFNAVWHTAGLVPTHAEFRHPSRWIVRMPTL
ncbi:hypothetical protein GTY54_37940 [Streptomyces sp. SID625]|nr:hypothetical protein [Streptomyces sp. SID625]